MTSKTLTAKDLPAADIEQTYLCARCGFCVQSCPTYQETGREPMCSRGRVQMVRGLLEGRLELTGALRDRIYACLGCGACSANCPSGVNVEQLMFETRAAMRRNGIGLPPLLEVLRGRLAGEGNPFGLDRGERGAWLPANRRPARPSETCLFMGCAVSFANNRTGKMILRILDEAGIDYTALGDDEECCGDPLVRLGETALAAELQARNKARFRQLGVKRIATPCAGCVKALHRDYPEFESRHIVEWVADLVREGKIRPEKPVPKRIIYFDGCDMGRHAGIYDAPRQILQAIPGVELIEYEKSREFAQCCGGPLMSNDPGMAKSIAAKRVAEALGKDADLIATACPTCLINLRGGNHAAEGRIDIQDVIGLLYMSQRT